MYKEKRCSWLYLLVPMLFSISSGLRNQMTSNLLQSQQDLYNSGTQLMRARNYSKTEPLDKSTLRLSSTVHHSMKMVSATPVVPMVAFTFGTRNKILVLFSKLMLVRSLPLLVLKAYLFQLVKMIWFPFSHAIKVNTNSWDKLLLNNTILPQQLMFLMEKSLLDTTMERFKL